MRALDDEEVKRVEAYKQLSPLEQDIFFLCSQYPVAEVADLYDVCRQHIYQRLKAIK